MGQLSEMRDEWRRLANAKPGTDQDRARKALGKRLILFGLFGVPILFFGVLLIAAVIASFF